MFQTLMFPSALEKQSFIHAPGGSPRTVTSKETSGCPEDSRGRGRVRRVGVRRVGVRRVGARRVGVRRVGARRVGVRRVRARRVGVRRVRVRRVAAGERVDPNTNEVSTDGLSFTETRRGQPPTSRTSSC